MGACKVDPGALGTSSREVCEGWVPGGRTVGEKQRGTGKAAQREDQEDLVFVLYCLFLFLFVLGVFVFVCLFLWVCLFCLFGVFWFDFGFVFILD